MLKKANINWSAKQLVKSIEKKTVRFDSSIQRSYEKYRSNIIA